MLTCGRHEGRMCPCLGGVLLVVLEPKLSNFRRASDQRMALDVGKRAGGKTLNKGCNRARRCLSQGPAPKAKFSRRARGLRGRGVKYYNSFEKQEKKKRSIKES